MTELLKTKPNIDKAIIQNNKKASELSKIVGEFYQQMYNYHNLKLERINKINLKNAYKAYLDQVLSDNDKQEDKLKSIMDQYLKDKAESDAKNVETVIYKG